MYKIEHRWIHYGVNGAHERRETRRVPMTDTGNVIADIDADEIAIERACLDLGATPEIARKIRIRAGCGDWSQIGVKPGEWFSCHW